MLILSFTMVLYGALWVVEKAYEIEVKANKTINDYIQEVNVKALTVLKRFPIIGWVNGTPKRIIFILAMSWLIFLLPIMCLMILLCFPL